MMEFVRHLAAMGGVLSKVRPDDLLAIAIKQLVDKNNISPDLIEDIIAGCTNQAGEDSRNIARNAALVSGLPVTTGGITVNRLCGSGLSAVLDASRTIRTGEGNILIAGEVESMSRSPWVLGKAEAGFDRNQKMFDSTLGWRFPNNKLINQYGDDSNSETADNIAVDVGISREDSDAFAYWSQQKYQRAFENGFFNDEVVQVEVPGASRKAPSVMIDNDEHPRPETTLEKLSTLKPVSEGGVVTAGNASGINDGAVALLIGNEEAGEKLGLQPRARVVCGAVVGVEPRVMGLGPVPATDIVMKRSGLGLDKMDVIEINEAFATQVLGCLKQMDLPFDDARLNPNGGAISLGHPLGASGARLVLTALRQLEASGGRFALVTMCIGIGQGIAGIIERIEQ